MLSNLLWFLKGCLNILMIFQLFSLLNNVHFFLGFTSRQSLCPLALLCEGLPDFGLGLGS
jgi:hypothetical protein